MFARKEFFFFWESDSSADLYCLPSVFLLPLFFFFSFWLALTKQDTLTYRVSQDIYICQSIEKGQKYEINILKGICFRGSISSYLHMKKSLLAYWTFEYSCRRIQNLLILCITLLKSRQKKRRRSQDKRPRDECFPPVCLSIAPHLKRERRGRGEFKRFFCSQKQGSREEEEEEEEEEERGDIYRFPTLEKGGREGEENILGARQEQEGEEGFSWNFSRLRANGAKRREGKERSFANNENREIGLCSEYF